MKARKTVQFLSGFMGVAALLCVTAYAADANAADANAPTVIRGVVKPVHKASISTELRAIVAEVPFREGEAFREGELILVFNCKRPLAELKAAKAASRAQLIDWKNKRELLRYKAIGANEVKLAEAAFAEAHARAEALTVQTELCEVKAPFNGRLVHRAINPHEMPSNNEPLLEIISDKALELDLIVPSTWLVWLKIGQSFDFIIDETGQRHQARVAQVGAAVDPVSQTIKIKGIFDELDSSVLSGMSGTATFHKSDS